jgi:hypothetical protein
MRVKLEPSKTVVTLCKPLFSLIFCCSLQFDRGESNSKKSPVDVTYAYVELQTSD